MNTEVSQRICRVILLAACTLARVHHADAVSCPGSGAKVKVTVVNPTGSTTPSITVSGSQITGEVTCTNQTSTYTSTFTVAANSSHTVTLPGSGGLNSGMWVHKILVSSTTQEQYQQVPVLYNSGTAHAEVKWNYFPDVVNVNVTGSSGSTLSHCPVDTKTNPATCDIAEAIMRANDNGTNRPVLIQFQVSPGTMNGNLTITAANVTIDGTDSSGNPRIVGDVNAAAAGSQDSFPRVMEFPTSNGLRVENDDVTLVGLKITQTTGGGNPTQNLLWLSANEPDNVLVRNVKLDAGANADCLAIGGSCTETNDLIKVPARGTAAAAANVRLVNVEGSGAIDRGLDAGDNTWAEVEGSWLHNNYRGNVNAGAVEALVIDESTVERAGMRQSDDLAVAAAAHGAEVSGAGFLITESTLFRNNLSNGVRLTGAAEYNILSDVWCGNGSDGLYPAASGGSLPSIVSSGGVGAAYNAGNGAELEEDAYSAQSLNDQSVFVANDQCGLYPRSTGIDAQNNQWRGTAPYPDTCPSAPGSLDLGTVNDHENANISVSSLSPTNALLQGQTIRISGSNFNAIDGNPLAASGGCDTGVKTTGGPSGGQGNSCCSKTTRANVCGNGTRPDPQQDFGQCVEIKSGSGTWTNMSVKALTPALIETEVPASVFGCLGGSGEEIRVSKERNDTTVSQQSISYCTSSIPFS